MTPEDVEGTWALVSYERERADGQLKAPLGPSPRGIIAYQAGRMSCVFTAADRPHVTAVPHSPELDAQRAAAYASCYAYAGRYEVVGDTLIHHVDVSLVPDWNGTAQVRAAVLDGDFLHLTAQFDEGERATTHRLTWRRMAAGEPLG